MNSKNIVKSLDKKLSDWIDSIDDKDVKSRVERDAIVTGGAIVSLLNGETPNDYDVYFKSLETCILVAQYYARKWNETHNKHVDIRVGALKYDEAWYKHRWVYANVSNDASEIVPPLGVSREDLRVQCFIQSAGAVVDDGESAIDDNTEPYATENEDSPTEQNPDIEKPKYRPRYFSTNAISLSDKIQIVIRFWGSVDKIHENYDFEHCKCSYDYYKNSLNLPVKSLECIINKELVYSGSKYPLCSIIRTRKFLSRGWTINAGQYVKMAWQLNELDLKDLEIFADQLVGVDSAYFEDAISRLRERSEKDADFELTTPYLFEIINRIF